MYLLLILLISPAFGRPSSGQLDVGGEISNQLEIFTNFNNETGKLLLNTEVIENVVKMLLEAERNILEMNTKLKTLSNQDIQFKDNYFPAYNEAKSYLRETRQGLRKLAHRTVADVRDLKLLLEGLDKNEDTVFLKISINKMKDLMIKTLETLKEAKEKYNSARETFENLNSSIKIQNDQLKILLTESSDEYKAWVRKKGIATRTVLGASGASLTLACVFLDLLFTFGICTGVNAVTLSVATPVIENEIAKKVEKYRVEFENMKNITDKMLESGVNFDEAIKEAITILNKEIELMGIWNQKAKTVSSNIDNSSEELLRKYKSVRNIFIIGLDDLKDAADKFLAQPEDILRSDEKIQISGSTRGYS